MWSVINRFLCSCIGILSARLVVSSLRSHGPSPVRILSLRILRFLSRATVLNFLRTSHVTLVNKAMSGV